MDLTSEIIPNEGIRLATQATELGIKGVVTCRATHLSHLGLALKSRFEQTGSFGHD